MCGQCARRQNNKHGMHLFLNSHLICLTVMFGIFLKDHLRLSSSRSLKSVDNRHMMQIFLSAHLMKKTCKVLTKKPTLSGCIRKEKEDTSPPKTVVPKMFQKEVNVISLTVSKSCLSPPLHPHCSLNLAFGTSRVLWSPSCWLFRSRSDKRVIR